MKPPAGMDGPVDSNDWHSELWPFAKLSRQPCAAVSLGRSCWNRFAVYKPSPKRTIEPGRGLLCWIGLTAERLNHSIITITLPERGTIATFVRKNLRIQNSPGVSGARARDVCPAVPYAQSQFHDRDLTCTEAARYLRPIGLKQPFGESICPFKERSPSPPTSA